MSFLSVPFSITSFLFGDKSRQIGDIKVNVVINESTNDTLTITKQPVQRGASITDHAYMEPTSFSTTIYFRDNGDQSLPDIYESLLALQSSMQPFTITTPKRTYDDMLIASLGMTTDKSTENCLAITATFQEVIIVDVATTTVPRNQQRSPGKTGATQPAGKKSMLAKAFGG